MIDLKLGTDYSLNGNQLNIYRYPSAVLKKIAEPITTFNDELIKNAKDMLFTMYNAPGIGLAAPQVGLSIQMFCIDTGFQRERVTLADGTDSFKFSNFQPKVLINPKIVKSEGEILYEEGCLSFPGIFEEIKRFENIVVEYQNLSGETVQIEATGTESICIQHELDHLKGILFIEKLSPLKRTLLLKKLNKKKKKKGNK